MLEPGIDYGERIAEALSIAPIESFRPSIGNLRGFGLLVAFWRLSRTQPDSLYKGAILLAGGHAVVQQLDKLSSFLPSSFDVFLTKIEAARRQNEIVDAGIFLTMALADLEKNGLWSLVKGWLTKPEPRQLMDALDRTYAKPQKSNTKQPVATAEERTALYLASLGWDESAIRAALRRA